MQKRIMSAIAVVMSMLLLIAGCSGGTKASDKAVSVGKQAIAVADDYLDGKMSYKDANEKLSELKEEMEYVDNLEQGDKHKAADFGVSTGILTLSTSMLSDSFDSTSDTYAKVVEARNSLAEKIGQKKR